MSCSFCRPRQAAQAEPASAKLWQLTINGAEGARALVRMRVLPTCFAAAASVFPSHATKLCYRRSKNQAGSTKQTAGGGGEYAWQPEE